MKASNAKPANCLNCGHVFEAGKPNSYCPGCGQKNLDRNISFLQLAGDFLSSVFSLDSQLANTLPPLFFRPGEVSKQYLDGKRVRYLSPLRLYLVVSILFFAVFNIYVAPDFGGQNELEGGKLEVSGDNAGEGSGEDVVYDFSANLLGDEDSLANIERGKALNRIAQLAKKYELQIVMDSLQAENNRFVEGWFGRHMVRQGVKMYQTKGSAWLSYLLRNLSFFIIFLMPFSALAFKLLYAFSGRYYLQHLVFHLHYHSFLYLLFSFAILLGVYVSGALWAIVAAYALLYLYLAMHKVYGQGRFWTLLKWLSFLVLYPFVLLFFTVAVLGVTILLF